MGRSIALVLLMLPLAVARGAAPLAAQASNPQAPNPAGSQAQAQVQGEGQQPPSSTAPTAEELAALRRAVEADLESVDKRLRFAQALIAAGRVGPAMDQLEEALAKAPGNAEAHAYLGLCYQLRGRQEDAVAAYRRALELDPNLFAAHNALAVLLIAKGEDGDARGHLERAIELEPAAVEPRLALASVLVRSGRFEDALARLGDALEAAGGKDPRVAYPLALLLAACPRESVCDAERALGLADGLYRAQPTPGNAQLLAFALGAAGRFDEAIQVQSELIKAAEEAGLGGELVERMRQSLGAFERHEQPAELLGLLGVGPSGSHGPGAPGGSGGSPSG